MYCTLDCRNAYYATLARERIAGIMRDRQCATCGASLADRADTKTKFCDHMCAKSFAYMKRRTKRRAKYGPMNCKRCGQPMPEGRRLGAVYCSEACKKQTLDENWRAKAPHYMRQYNYGLTPSDFAALLAKQDGRCAICRTNDFTPKRNPGVDHCHGSGVVRGLLCGRCNAGLGQFKDDPALLRAAASYLEAHASA